MAFLILVSDPLAPEGIRRLKEQSDVEVHVHTDWSQQRLIGEIGRYDALVVRSGTQVNAEVIEAADRLRVIGRAGVGVDNIDVAAATKRGILVVNSPDGNTLAAAEHTVAMLLALARQIPQAHHSLVYKQEWERGRFIGVQLTGKVLGVLGLGRIGTEVARRAAGMDMKILGYDPFISADRARKLGIELASVDEICRAADFITVHTPLTKQTEGLVGERQFDLMKPGARVINCARGGIIDEAALYRAIAGGKVAGAALDVFVSEPPFESPLLQLPQVIATPHLGASTHEAQITVAVDVAESLLRALRGRPVRSSVNAPMFRFERFDLLEPYLDLCERLGNLFTALFDGGHDRLEVVYAGAAAELEASALSTALLKGMLSSILHEQVNFVNAPLFAEERGLSLVEIREATVDDFPNLITLRGKGPRGEVSVSGTVVQGHAPTLVDIDGYRVNVTGTGLMLVARNVDQPGIVGRVGTVLGEADINIAFMQVGRKFVGGHAVMVLGIDNRIDDAVLTRLSEIEALSDIHVVEW